MLQRILHILFSAPVLCVCLIACHSSEQGKVAASPPPRFHEPPKQLGVATLPFADTTKPEWPAVSSRLDSFYRKQVLGGFNGSVLIGYKGQILYERYYGAANREKGIPWSPQTASQLASTSKTFTGAA